MRGKFDGVVHKRRNKSTLDVKERWRGKERGVRTRWGVGKMVTDSKLLAQAKVGDRGSSTVCRVLMLRR